MSLYSHSNLNIIQNSVTVQLLLTPSYPHKYTQNYWQENETCWPSVQIFRNVYSMHAILDNLFFRLKKKNPHKISFRNILFGFIYNFWTSTNGSNDHTFIKKRSTEFEEWSVSCTYTATKWASYQRGHRFRGRRTCALFSCGCTFYCSLVPHQLRKLPLRTALHLMVGRNKK